MKTAEGSTGDRLKTPGEIMCTHPYIREQLIRESEHELARSAARYAPLMTGRERARRSLRYRAGWTLVEIGLALVRRSGLEAL